MRFKDGVEGFVICNRLAEVEDGGFGVTVGGILMIVSVAVGG